MNLNVDTLEEYSTLEWIKSDRIGETEIFVNTTEENGMKWINFLSGGRLNANLLNEFMSYLGKVPEENIDNIKLKIENAKKDVDIIKEETNTTLNGHFVNLPHIVREDIINKRVENNFYFDILDKAKKDENKLLNIQLEFNFLSYDKLQILIDIYGEEILENAIEYIYSKITKEDIINSIKSNLINRLSCGQQDSNEKII